jgi:hypothetical protein
MTRRWTSSRPARFARCSSASALTGPSARTRIFARPTWCSRPASSAVITSGCWTGSTCQPDRSVDPGEGVAEGDDQGDAGQACPGAVVEPETDTEPEADDERQRQHAAADVGQGPAGQERGPGHRQAPEAIDDAGLRVLGQGECRGHAAYQPNRFVTPSTSTAAFIPGRGSRQRGSARGARSAG